MSRNRWVILLGLILVVLAGALVVAWRLPPEKADSAYAVALDIVLTLGLVGLFRWPRGMALIRSHPKWIMALGALMIAGGLGAVVIAPDDRGLQEVWIWLIIIGFLMLGIPRMVARMETSKAETASLVGVDRPTPAFDGVAQGILAPLSVLRDWRTFLQIAGPWLLLLVGTAVFAGVRLDQLGIDHIQPTSMLLALLCWLVALAISLPVVGASWVRWTLLGQRPRGPIALPDRASMTLMWRLWVFNAMLGVVDGGVSGYVANFMKGAHWPGASIAADVAGFLVDILVVGLASTFALRLPAIVVGDKSFSLTVAVYQGRRRMWPGLAYGLVLSLAPFVIVSWLFSLALDGLIGDDDVKTYLPITVILAVGLVLYFAAYASAATYLSKAYRSAKAAAEGIAPEAAASPA